MMTWPHYKVVDSIKNVDDVRSIFPEGQANKLNWLFLSTSGVHGTSTTLDEIAYELDDREHAREHEQDVDLDNSITVLVVQPRLCVLRYGHITVTPEDIPYLRGLVRSTLEAVAKSQEGNI